MKRIIVAFLLVLNIGIAYGADKKITSKTYVDNQIATKQDKIPAVDTNTVITHTGTSGDIGQKAIYDSNESYVSQQTALMTAGDANTGINNALENEFICIEEDTDHTCLIWKIKNTANLLPSEYTQLAYLKSTGTQYIDTEITPTNSTGVKVKYNRLVDGDQVIVGTLVNGTSGSFDVNMGNSGLYLAFGESWQTSFCAVPYSNVIYEVSMNYNNDRKRYVNGVDTKDITNTLGVSDTMYAFAGHNQSGANWFFRGEIYYLKITNGTSLVRDFIPAQRNSDNVLGMYDTVTNTFFTNSGSGEFIAGPVLDVYIPSND